MKPFSQLQAPPTPFTGFGPRPDVTTQSLGIPGRTFYPVQEVNYAQRLTKALDNITLQLSRAGESGIDPSLAQAAQAEHNRRAAEARAFTDAWPHAIQRDQAARQQRPSPGSASLLGRRLFGPHHSAPFPHYTPQGHQQR
ncbi:MAG: hypothetical protein AAF526_01770 [Pseudomonadota bacterium]